MGNEIEVGLIGFGLGGEVFHAPLIRSVPRLSLRRVATSKTEAAAKAGLEATRAETLIADPSIDLIVIASPNATHYPLTEAALRAGKHVVVDKPFATSAAQAERLTELARERELGLTVFHNRRWDGDFLTVRKLIEDRQLGDVMLYEACWDRFRPGVNAHWKEAPEPGAGLLNDLGPHLIDQALVLFGWPEAVTADMGPQREGAAVDDYFDLLLHYGKTRVRLGASQLVAMSRPRFQIHGTGGSFVKHGLDPQQGQLKSGVPRDAERYGAELEDQFGILTPSSGGASRVPTEKGRYHLFYEGVADMVGGGAAPVDPADAERGLALMEAARVSSAERRTVPLS
ncbi:MAG TPA: Gfo/Idh/MocA family oxidoreductase [Allosphingosinicella sp.]|uniref:Gfo/Idh/MocA family oxidoreductase n=1 Tax=Allosphingosinicella sp. TaxID=2823234 RepID=UPI002EDB46E7